MIRRLCAILFVVGLGFSADAYHIVGGDITYRCLGNNTYEITMIIYRDCNSKGAGYDKPAYIAVYNDTLFKNLALHPTGIRTLPADIYDPCFSVPTGVCTEIGFYSSTIYLPPNNGGYTLSYQRCCRNSSLRNIETPDKVGTTITTKIPGSFMYGCNTSPVFKSAPPIAICLGSDFVFDHSATDANGDSLVYKFCDPYLGGSDAIMTPGPPNSIMPIPATKPPYQTIKWAAGYSTVNPFNIANPFQLDAKTGEIAGIPAQTGQYLYGLCVEEFRNNVKIGETRREFQVNVVRCESNTEAKFTEPLPCTGLEQELRNNSITSKYFAWDFDMDNPGTHTSSAAHPIFQFPDTGTYTVRLIANPGFDCADTVEKKIQVYPPVFAEIEGNAFACQDAPRFKFNASGTFESYTQMYWSFGEGSSIEKDTGIETNELTVERLGKFSVELLMTHAVCSNRLEIFPEVVMNPKLKVAKRNIKGCAPLLVELENLTEAASDVTTIWTVNDFKKSSSVSNNPLERWRFNEKGNFTISLLAYTSEKCRDTVGPLQIPIEVFDSPTANFTVTDTVVSIFSPEIEVFSSPINASDCELFVGSPKPELGCSGFFEFEKPGIYRVSQVVTNESGCTDTLSKSIVVEDEYAFFAPNSFSPNSDGKNEVFRPIVVGSKEYEFTIHDRWGHIIFTSIDPKIGWSGEDERTGEEAPIGVYLFQAKVFDFQDEFHFYSGEVNLFR